MPVRQVFLALGSNTGDRESNLRRAIEAIQTADLVVKRCSSIYETEPQDVVGQPWFLNMVIECETSLFPRQLLAVLQQVERQLGRIRAGSVPRGPRPIDLDILLFGKLSIAADDLTIPHPRMLQRRFVLEPLLEIAPELRYPGTQKAMVSWLKEIKGQAVKRIGTLAACPSE